MNLEVFSVYFYQVNQLVTGLAVFNVLGRTGHFLFLGGTSSILKTFRVGPVKKHPVDDSLVGQLSTLLVHFFQKNGNSYKRSCLQVFVAFVVTLPSSISSPLPQWSSEKVNNNLERINVTNKENTHTRRGKQQFHMYFRWDMYSRKGQICIFGFYRSEMGQFEWLCFAL